MDKNSCVKMIKSLCQMTHTFYTVKRLLVKVIYSGKDITNLYLRIEITILRLHQVMQNISLV